MNYKSLKFTGRNNELEKIIESWQRASNINDPNPQVVLIKGERGVGKTRLAFEFYRWLSENIDPKIQEYGYWPDVLAIHQNAINVNPLPKNCNFDIQIPYLWWGLHVSSKTNPIDTISAHDSYLAPHLAMLLATAIKKQKGLDLAAALVDLGIDVGISFIEDLTYLGLIKRLAEGVKKGRDIVRGGMEEISIEKALQVPQSRAISILQQLEKVFNQTRGYASIPGVILIDDAQDIDSERDPAILVFIEQLLHSAVTQKWPILILFTHWKRELSPEVTPQEYSFAGLLRHCLKGNSSESGPAAGLAGGFLNETNFSEIDLGPLDDLSIALYEYLPGLTKNQSSGILRASGGNPKFLEQIIHFALENEGFFNDFDSSRPLSDAGYNELLLETKSQDIFKIVRRRLLNAPSEIKEAICLASLQGTRFVNDIVNAIAKIQLDREVQIPLEKAEDPYSWITGTKSKSNDGVGAFAEHLFYQVAENVRPHIKSFGGESKLIASFKDIIRGLLEDDEFRSSDRHETQLIVYNIAADLFENSSDERPLAQRAMSYIAKVHLYRSSLEAATAAYERLLKTPPSHRSEWQDRIQILDFLAAAYQQLNWPSKASNAYKRIIWMGYHQIDDQNQRVFVFSRTPEEVKQIFQEWKQKRLKNIIEGKYFDDVEHQLDKAFIEKRLEADYFSSTSVIVRALLELAELALAWPSLIFDDGDDPVSEAPFMIKALKRGYDGNITGEKYNLPESEIYLYLKERAYVIGTLLDKHFAQYEHFQLLTDNIAHFHYDNDPTKAIDALNRALAIAEEMDDLILQIQILNNLGAAHVRNGNYNKAKEILSKAGKIHNDTYGGEAFPVVIVSNNGKIEFHRAEAIVKDHELQIVGQINISIQFSSLFDSNPEEVVSRTRKLMAQVGDIEGNFGMIFLKLGEFDKAEKQLEYAMESYVDLNDGPKMAMTYTNLGVIAQHRGDLETACNLWNRSIAIYEKLVEFDNGNGRDIIWKSAIKELEKIKKYECGNTKSVDNEL